MYHDPDFMPFTPREKPSFRANARNFLENWPPAAYREGFASLPGLWPLIGKTHFLTDPELIEELLITRANDFPRDFMTVRALSSPINRDSLFFAEGADWKWQRRAVAPAFRHENILALVPTFARCAAAQGEVWRAREDAAAPIDAMSAMSRTTFAVIARAVLGEESGALDEEKFIEALSPALASVTWRRIYAFAGLPEWAPCPGYFKTCSATRHLYGETAQLVAARRASGSSRHDVLGLLLSARDPELGRVMTDAELIGNLYSFMFAGHETSAVALGWALWLLAKDKASQERLREEVREIAGESGIGPDTVERLAFTRQVI